MAAAALGTVAFGLAHSLELAYAGRFLIGAGSAVGFIGSLALASQWFPPRRFATLAGLAMLIAMIGGFAGQAPLAALINIFGWRATMVASGAVAAGLAIDCTGGAQFAAAPHRARPAPAAMVGAARGLSQAVRSSEVWLVAIVGSSMSGPMLAFGGLWGVPYLMVAYDLPRPQAALLVSMMLAGWALGAPVSGWVSDYIGRRKAPLIASVPSWPCWSSSFDRRAATAAVGARRGDLRHGHGRWPYGDLVCACPRGEPARAAWLGHRPRERHDGGVRSGAAAADRRTARCRYGTGR
jgi:MFS family permease